MKRSQLGKGVLNGLSISAVSAFALLGAACSQASETEAVQTAAPQAVEAAEIVEVAAPQAEPVASVQDVSNEVVQQVTEQATDIALDTATEAETAAKVDTATPQVKPVSQIKTEALVAKAEERVVEAVPAAVQTVAAPAIQEAERVITTAEGLEAKAASLQEEASIDDVVADVSLSVSGDAEAGKRVFAVCRSCHSTDAGRNGLGPSLAGIVGREAGTIEGFKYSDAIKASGVTWTPENLDSWLIDTAGFIPGNKMSQLFRPGVQDETKRADLIAYLATL